MQEIYFDNAATTKTHTEVAQSAMRIMCDEYGNPSSLHTKGFSAQKEFENAQKTIASAIGANSDEIIFTSGGTESNNLAIFGTARALSRRGKRIITTQLEHAAILEPVKMLENEGFDIIELPPLSDGSLDLAALEEAVNEDTILVSCMMVNSEIGAISPIEEAVKIVKTKNPSTVFHTDAVQAFTKLPISVRKLGVDLLSMSAHKIHAPKGVGALYIRDGVRLVPLMYGGEQQKTIRSGTENTPGAVAFAKAVELANKNYQQEHQHIQSLCKHFINKAQTLEGVCINSTPKGSPYICNISVIGYRSEIMLHYLAERGILVSSGSACSKGAKSHVLSAMGLTDDRIDSAIRVSFSAQNTTQEIDVFFEVLEQARQQLIRS